MEEAQKNLIEGTRKGTQGKFEELLETYRPLVVSTVSSFAHSSELEREDLMQEATIAFFRAAQTYDLDSESVTFGLYAKICIRNRLISLARKAKASARQKKSDSADESAARSSDAHSFIEADKLSELISSLTVLEREVLSGRLSGLSYEEIAKKIGKDAKCVDNALVRIRRKSKKL